MTMETFERAPAPASRVFNPDFCRRMAESNNAIRQLRALGVRPLSCTVEYAAIAIVVDRNMHTRLSGCPHVYVTHNFGRAA